jgi:hypothetical protein
MTIFKGGRVTKNPFELDTVVDSSQPKQYHCLYCHSSWHETARGKCINCGSGNKVCNSSTTSKKSPKPAA